MGTVWAEVWGAELNPLLIANKASRKSMHSVQILQHIHGVGGSLEKRLEGLTSNFIGGEGNKNSSAQTAGLRELLGGHWDPKTQHAAVT